MSGYNEGLKNNVVDAQENKKTDQKERRRGFDENDDRWFAEEAVKQLQLAQEELIWLLDRGYKLNSIIELVGGHYQLSSRQRIALQRASCSSEQKKERQRKQLSYQAATEDCLYIDGFNLIITLEVALSGSVLILGNDGCIRDMAGLRGTYRLIDKTDIALQLIGKILKELQVPYIKFFLDAPVSNSGRLKTEIMQQAKLWKLPVEVELVSNPDTILSKLEKVVTADSVILDNCTSWLNLSRKIIETYIKDARIINLSGKEFGLG